jgi:hypothetical protein
MVLTYRIKNRGKIKDPVTVKPSRHKYHNQKVNNGSVTFDSKLEEKRYYQLRNNPLVVYIEVHPTYVIFPETRKMVNGKMKTFQKITYTPDFRVTYNDGRVEVEDVKGVCTEAFMIKRKLFEAAFPELTLKIVRACDMRNIGLSILKGKRPDGK